MPATYVYQRHTLTIAANSRETINTYANFFCVLSGDGLEVSFNDQAAQAFPAGLAVELPKDADPATKVDIVNGTGDAITADVCLTLGRVFDNRTVIDAGASAIPTTPAGMTITGYHVDLFPFHDNNYIGGVSGQRKITVQNTSATDILVSDDTTLDYINPEADHTGVMLAPGEKWTFETADQLNVMPTNKGPLGFGGGGSIAYLIYTTG